MGVPRLERLTLRNVRCFGEAEVPLHHRVTLVLGENGAGKTTVAEVIASLVHRGDGLERFPLRRGESDGRAEIYEQGSKKPVARWRARGGGADARETLPPERLVFGYGQHRRTEVPLVLPKLGDIDILGPAEAALLAEPRIEDRLSELVMERRTTTLVRPDPLLLRDLGKYILYLHRQREGDPRIGRAWDRLNESFRLVHNLDRVDVIVRDDREVPVVVRRGVELEFRDLSAGYQSILVVLLDLVLRYVYLFPTLDDPLQGEAVVVIDEVDLHLHPRWQRVVVEQLVTLLPATQFVLTTHSAAVVQGAIDSEALAGDYAVVALREPREGCVQVTELTAKALWGLRGAQVSSVLVDDRLFDVPSRWALRYERVERRIRRLRRKAEAGTATQEERERLVALLDQMQGLLAREEERLAERPLLSEIAKTQVAFLKGLVAELGGRGRDGASGSQGEPGPT